MFLVCSHGHFSAPVILPGLPQAVERIAVTQRHPWERWDELEKLCSKRHRHQSQVKWVWLYLCVNSTPSFERKLECLQTCHRECNEITINLMTNTNPYGVLIKNQELILTYTRG